MTARSYLTAEGFKRALEQRLTHATTGGRGLVRQRQLLVFERFLARVIDVMGDAVTLKGGLVLEFRLERARSTKDVDLRMVGSSDNLLEKLQAVGRRDLMDFMTFELSLDKERPEMQGDGIRYDGLRFRAACRLAGKPYAQPFGVDVAFGDPMVGEPESFTTRAVLDFAGISPPTLRLYPIETHIAEKLHAYTMPRPSVNSRVKDLPDLALLATVRPLDARRLRVALERTFEYRKTHALPGALPEPPPSWVEPYAKMVRDDALQWPSLAAVTIAARAFLAPVLSGDLDARWTPSIWSWEARE